MNGFISPKGDNLAFNKFKANKEIYKFYDDLTSLYVQTERPIPNDVFDILLGNLRFFDSTKSSHRTEYFYSHLIYYILAAVCAHVPSTEIAIEEDIIGQEVKAHGRFDDYMWWHKNLYC